MKNRAESRIHENEYGERYLVFGGNIIVGTGVSTVSYEDGVEIANLPMVSFNEVVLPNSVPGKEFTGGKELENKNKHVAVRFLFQDVASIDVVMEALSFIKEKHFSEREDG